MGQSRTGNTLNEIQAFVDHQVMQEFLGGNNTILDFLVRNIYLPDAVDTTLDAGCFKVYTSFVIRKTGEVDSVPIVRGILPAIDNEVKRALLSMPKWKSGTINGTPVDTKFAIPVRITFN